MGVQQSREELISHLREQVGFLRVSCNAVDDGNVSEGKRIAVTLRVLLHESVRSRSLLEQLGLIANMEFFGTAGSICLGEVMTQHGLIGIVIEKGQAKYRAPLGDRPPHMFSWNKFEDWWKQPVFLDRDGRRISREQLVLSVANKDGGAHVDPVLNKEYAELTRANSLDWRVVSGKKEEAMGPNPALLSVRQMAFEVLTSLERHVPEIIKEE